MAMNKEFTDLVQEYLTDGIISAKERAVLLKKAEKLGIDVDEADLYIDAQQQKEDMNAAMAEKKKKGKACPFCGGSINDLVDKCPHCGGNITPEATRELQEILDNLEDALVAFKAGKNIAEAKALVERYARKANLYYANNSKVTLLLEEIKKEVVEVDAKVKKQAIWNFFARHWKLIAGVVAVCIAAIVIVIATRPTSAEDPQLCIEEVNKALKSGDVAEAEAICSAYYQEHCSSIDHYNEVKAVEPACVAIIRYQTKVLTSLINSGDFDGACAYLGDLTIHPVISHPGTSNIVEKYDPIFLKLITALVDRGDLDSAESVALMWKSKIGNDLSWVNSSCYTLLKSKYQAAGRDFSLLKSSWD